MYEDVITALISSSPIPSHPSTAIIEETIASIRRHLPDIPIFIMCDGVREEQKDREEDYREYRKKLVTKMLFEGNGITVFPFPFFVHQANMTRTTLEMVKTPQILFVEADTPLVDRPIDWELLTAAITGEVTNHIRLHYDETIHKDHQHLMCGKLSPHLIKCVQWHQRPHLARTDWYKSVLNANFTPQSRTWIEDRVYGPVSSAAWEDYRLTIYDPNADGQNMKRSRDLNGRAGDTKYPPQF